MIPCFKPTPEEEQAARRRMEIAKAHKQFKEWRKAFVSKLCAAYRVAHIALRDMEDGDKLTEREALAIRWQSCFHLSSFSADVPISAETMAGATSVAEFLGAHAEAAYQAMGADESIEDAKYLWRRVFCPFSPFCPHERSFARTIFFQMSSGRWPRYVNHLGIMHPGAGG